MSRFFMSGNTSSMNLVQIIVLICENNVELNPTACDIIGLCVETT